MTVTLPTRPASWDRAARIANRGYTRDSEGKFAETPGGALDGITVMSNDEYHKTYGEPASDAGVSGVFGNDTQLSVRVFESGDAHLVIDLEDDGFQPLHEMNQATMREFAEALDWAANAEAGDGDTVDEESGLVDWNDVDGTQIGYTPDGTVRLTVPKEGVEGFSDLDLDQDQALALSEAFTAMADQLDDVDTSWSEFGNNRLPSTYLDKYGKVVDEIEFSADGNMTVAVTDKGYLHLASGFEDRKVLVELTPRAARNLADDLYDVYSGEDDDVRNSDTGALISANGTDEMTVVWADGSRTLLPSDDGFALQEALTVMAGRFGERFGRRFKPPTNRAARAGSGPGGRVRLENLAGQPHTGAMIALVPTATDVGRLAIVGGEPADQLHLTLWYLGEAAAISDDSQTALVNAVRSMVERRSLPPVEAQAFGANLWNPDSDNPAWVLAVGDLPDEERPDGQERLAVCREMISEAWHDGAVVMDVPPQHTPWQPHICLAYSADPDLLPAVTDRTGPVTFDRVRVAFGETVVDVPLGAKAAPAALPGEMAMPSNVTDPTLLVDREYHRDDKGRFAENPGTDTPNAPDSPAGGGGSDAGSSAKTSAGLTRDDFIESGSDEDETVSARAAKSISERWDVTNDDLMALATADLAADWLAGVPEGERREAYARKLIGQWNSSSGGAIPTAAITAVADRLGLGYKLTDSEQRTNAYIRGNEALSRATAGFGEAMYATTQEWLAERGVTELRVYRSGRGREWDDARPFTSWSVNKGGTKGGDQDPNFRDEVVPASRILSVPPTGFGTMHESEAVLLPAAAGAATNSGRLLHGRPRADFDPGQKRDGHGRWTDGMPEIIGTASVRLLGGDISIDAVARSDGDDGWIRISDGTHTANVGGSYATMLDRRMPDLREEMEVGETASVIQPERQDDGTYVSVPLYAVTKTGRARFELKIANPDDTHESLAERRGVEMTYKQFGDVVESALMMSSARRIKTDGGPVDFYPTADSRMGVRVKDTHGEVRDMSFSEQEWAKIHNAINVVWEGFDENEEPPAGAPDDWESTPVSEIQIPTSVGLLVVAHADDRLTISPVASDDWHITWAADFRHPIWEAMDEVGSAAGIDTFIANSIGMAGKARRAIHFARRYTRDDDGKISEEPDLAHTAAKVAGAEPATSTEEPSTMAASTRRTQRPQGARAKTWYRITNKASEAADVYLYSEIGCWGISADMFARELGEVTAKVINLHINSPGGEVLDGIAIHSTLKKHPARIDVSIDGVAASAASFIAQAGDKVTIMRHAQMMIHDASGFCMGDSRDMRKTADLLESLSETIADIYSERAGGDAATWRARMQVETWLNAKEALAIKLVDEIDGSPAGPEANAKTVIDLKKFPYAYAGREQAPDPVLTPVATAVEPAGDSEPVITEPVEVIPPAEPVEVPVPVVPEPQPQTPTDETAGWDHPAWLTNPEPEPVPADAWADLVAGITTPEPSTVDGQHAPQPMEATQ